MQRAARVSTGVALLLGLGNGCAMHPDTDSTARDQVRSGVADGASYEFPVKTPLSRVPFLMAHDAATTYGHDYGWLGEIIAGQVQTQQDGGFTALLDCGVRALDVRPCYEDRQLYMHHGIVTVRYPLQRALREIVDWSGLHHEALVLIYVSHCGGGHACRGGPQTPNEQSELATDALLAELGITTLESVDISYGEAVVQGRLANGGSVLAVEQVMENYDPSIQYCAGPRVKANAFSDLFSYMDRIAGERPSGRELVMTQAHWQDPHSTFVDGCAETVLEMESASGLNKELAARIAAGRWPHVNLLEVDNACDQGVAVKAALEHRFARRMLEE